MLAPALALALLAPAAPRPADPAPNPFGKAFLGIQSEDGFSLVVGTALPGMPAEKAGVRPGDRVLRVGSLVPGDFTQLAAHVQTYRPGATIEVEVERDGAKRTFSVRLAPRPPTADTGSIPLLPFPRD